MTTKTELADECEVIRQKLLDAERLILWMARTYNDNDPIFMFVNQYGQELPENRNLFRTWQRIVRRRSDNEIDAMLDYLGIATPLAQLPLDDDSSPRETPEGHTQGE